MSDNESDAPKSGGSSYLSANVPSRPQRSQRIDYHLLNGGSDEEADVDVRAIKKPIHYLIALNQWVEKSPLVRFIGICLPHHNPFRKGTLREASPRLYSLTSQSANPSLSHKINGSGANSKSSHFQENYGVLSEADGYWRTEKSSVHSVVGKPPTLQGQLLRPT